MSVKRRSAALFAAALSVVSISHAQTSGTWANDVGTGGGVWSDSFNWAGGVIPNAGGGAFFTALPSFTTAPLAINQDLAGLTVGSINFDTQITYQFVASAQPLTLVGAAAINANQPSTNSLSITTFGQLFQGTLAGTAGLTKNGPGTVTLWSNTNSFSGDININDGILVVRQFGDLALGNAANAINFDGGTLRVTTGSLTTSRAVNLVGDGTIEATTTGTVNLSGAISGVGSLNKLGSRGLNLTAANTYSGATNILAGSIGLSGNGAILSTSSIVCRDTLTLDNTGTINSTNRVGDSTPITLNGAALSLAGNATLSSSESLGAATISRGQTNLTVTGLNSTLTLASLARSDGATAFFRGNTLGSGGVSTISITSAPTLVGGGGAAGTTKISIIPWAYGSTNGAGTIGNATASFVTYGATGIRPLDVATEYVANLTTAAADDNVRINAPVALASPTSVNSLILAPGGGAYAVSGATTLTIASGALLNLTTSTLSAATLDFGSAEGIVNAQGSLALSSTIVGTGGLTKAGPGVATLSAANEYTGPTIVGGGTLAFTSSVLKGSPSPLGADTSAVSLSPAGLGTGGTTGRLVYVGAASASFERDLLVSGRIALNNSATIPGFGINSAGTLVMNGSISLDDSPLSLVGAAGSTLRLNGAISGNGLLTDGASTSTSTIILAASNTFTGGAEIATGTWAVASDTAFGIGGPIKVIQTSGAPTILALDGPHTIPNPSVSLSFSATYWIIGGNQPLTFTGSINLSGSYTHNIANSALTTYAGVLHTGGFTKTGSGTLLLSGDNAYGGTTTISSGVLQISHANALGFTAQPTIVANGAALEVLPGTLSDEPVTISGTGLSGGGAVVGKGGATSLGDVTVAANASVNVVAGSLSVGNVAGQGLTKVGAGELRVNQLRVTSFTASEGTTRVKTGDDVGGTSVISQSLGFSTGAFLDIGDNGLIYDYTTTSTAGDVRTFIQNGTAATSGLISSAAGAGQRIGYADNAVLQLSSFYGEVVDTSSVLVAMTYAGDANLDGIVDITDLAALATAWQTAGVWTDGDFNYDGVIDITDLAALATNWQAGVGTLQTALQSLGLPGVSVPEPAAIMLLAGLPLLKRRRRSVR